MASSSPVVAVLPWRRCSTELPRASEMAGAVGFPLGDGAAADVAGGGELELGEAAGAAEFADARADGRGGGVHGGSMRECC
jgi:hypothetical protein